MTTDSSIIKLKNQKHDEGNGIVLEVTDLT